MFQSTRPRGRTRLPLSSGRREPTSFNPRVLAGGRDKSPTGKILHPRFQSTRPRGRTRQSHVKSALEYYHVSIHASSREDATTTPHRTRFFMSFNPRVLAGGRDFPGLNWTDLIDVSIHASSREDATRLLIRLKLSVRFQSTRPPATMVDKYPFYLMLFQSTRPRGRTRHVADDEVFGYQVSIHASSREDATRFIIFITRTRRFQSTRPRGRTRPCASITACW